jgi:hypothetical protein
MSTIALPRPNTNGGLWLDLVAWLVGLMSLLLLLLPQVAVREMRVECTPIYLTNESGVPLTSDDARYLVADDAATCR